MTPPTCVLRVVFLLWLCLHPVRTVRVDLSRQQLNAVPRTLNRDVEILILNHNGLRTLNNSSFDLYPDLEELSLEYCKIELIQEGTFDRKVKLQIISFSHKLTTLCVRSHRNWSGWKSRKSIQTFWNAIMVCWMCFNNDQHLGHYCIQYWFHDTESYVYILYISI